MAQFSIRIPDEMKEELEKIASKNERSLSFIVKKAIEQYLKQVNKEKECQNDTE